MAVFTSPTSPTRAKASHGFRTLDWDDELLRCSDPPPNASGDPVVVGTEGGRCEASNDPSALRCRYAATWGISRPRPWAGVFLGARRETPTETGNFCSQRRPDPTRRRQVSSRRCATSLARRRRCMRSKGLSPSQGSAVQWLRDQLGIIGTAGEVETLANTVPDNGGAYFVPAFSGLFAPYWRSDAAGAIVGLSRFQHQRAFGTGHARSHLLPDARRARCNDYRLWCEARRPEGRRRRNREQHADAAYRRTCLVYRSSGRSWRDDGVGLHTPQAAVGSGRISRHFGRTGVQTGSGNRRGRRTAARNRIAGGRSRGAHG